MRVRTFGRRQQSVWLHRECCQLWLLDTTEKLADDAFEAKPAPVGYLQETHKWPLTGFPWIGTLRRHLTELGA
jgi:hypothetical protein